MQKNLKYYFRIFKYSEFIILFNIIERLFSFIIFLCFARIYSVNLYGEIITVFTFSTIIITLFDLGFPLLLQREVSLLKDKSSGILCNIIHLNVLILFLYFMFVLFLYRVFYSYISFDIFIFTSLYVYIYSLINLFNAALSGLNLFKKKFQLLLFSRVLILLLLFPLIILLNVEISVLLIIISAGCLFQVVLIIMELKKNGLLFNIPFNIPDTVNIVKVSFPLGLAVIFNFLYDKFDIVIISKLTDFSQVAFYNVGYGVFKASAVAFSFLFVSGFTRVSQLSNRKYAVKLFFIKYLKTLILISIFLTIIFFFFSDLIIKIIYTEKYSNSVIILKILSFAILGLSLNSLTGIILNGIGYFKENMIITLIGFVINIILNIFLIPIYGIVAAAVVSLITEYFIFAGDYYYLNKFFKVKHNGNF